MIPKFPKSLLLRLIWTYFFLLILEGAFRKWVFPGLADPLLIIRDPLVILIYIVSAYRGVFRLDGFTLMLIVIGLLSGIATMLVGHGNLAVTVFGVRTLILHFPLIFVIARTMKAEDVIELTKLVFWMVIPMTVIIVWQFTAPQTAWINRAPGGVEGGGFSGALGKYRPPGTFSFTTGIVQFYSMATALFISFIMQVRKLPPVLFLAIVSGCLLLAIPVSISRSLFLLVLLSLAFLIFAGVIRGRLPRGISSALIVGVLGLGLIAQTDTWDEGVSTFSARWENSTGEERGGVKTAILGRFFEGLMRPFMYSDDVPFLGYGIGAGTQVGAKFMTGERGFNIAEGEWDRLVREMGLILGAIVIGLRVYFCIRMFLYAQKKLHTGLIGPWVLFPVVMLLVLNGQWGQPTTLGFMAFATGIFFSLGRAGHSTKSPTLAKA